MLMGTEKQIRVARRVRGPSRRTFAWALALLATLAGGLAAEEVPPDPRLAKVTELEAQVAEHKRQKAAAALVADAKTALDVHKLVADEPTLKKRVLNVFRDLLRSVKEDKEKQSVLEALGGTADPDAASIVKPLLRQPNVEEAGSLLMAAIRAAGQVPDKDTVQPLVALVDKSKHMGAAAAAMTALGSFGKVKPQREKILQELVDIVEPLQPGGRPGARGSGGGIGDPSDPVPSGPASQGGAAAKWAALSAALPGALNALTRRTISSPGEWFQIVKENKRDLGKLFNDD